MFRLFALLICLVSAAASARAWKGIDPGTSTRADVVEKFGPPSKKVTAGGKEVLAYLGKQAIKGTTQTQFKIDPKTGKVERIDVFPGPKIDKAIIENSYGKACPEGSIPDTPCYLKKVTDDFKLYFHYPRLGLAIFFSADGKTVSSFIFQAARVPEKK